MRIITSSILCGLLLACTSGIAYPLRRINVESITNTVHTHFNGMEMKLNVMTKKQRGIRATVFSKNGKENAVLIFDQRELYQFKKEPTEAPIYRRVTGREAAENLFQMLALNPWFHFPRGTLALRCDLLDHFEIVYHCDMENQDTYPLEMHLYHTADAEPILLSTIEFVDFFSDSAPLHQPKTLRVTDHSMQTVGMVEVENFAYNKGVADYLFKRPKDRSHTYLGP